MTFITCSTKLVLDPAPSPTLSAGAISPPATFAQREDTCVDHLMRARAPGGGQRMWPASMAPASSDIKRPAAFANDAKDVALSRRSSRVCLCVCACTSGGSNSAGEPSRGASDKWVRLEAIARAASRAVARVGLCFHGREVVKSAAKEWSSRGLPKTRLVLSALFWATFLTTTSGRKAIQCAALKGTR